MKVTTRDTPIKPVHSKSGRSLLEFCSHTLSLLTLTLTLSHYDKRGGDRGLYTYF